MKRASIVVVLVSLVPGAAWDLATAKAAPGRWVVGFHGELPAGIGDLYVDGGLVLSLGAEDSTTFSGSLDTTSFSDRSHAFEARCRDADGRVRAAPRVHVVDNLPDPSVRIVAPIDGTVAAAIQPVVIEAVSAVAGSLVVEVRVNQGPWQPVLPASAGNHYVYPWIATSAPPESTVWVRASDAGGESFDDAQVLVAGPQYVKEKIQEIQCDWDPCHCHCGA